MPLLSSVTNCREEIEITLDDQISYTRWRGYQRYLAKWKDQPEIDSIWLTKSKLRQIDSDVIYKAV